VQTTLLLQESGRQDSAISVATAGRQDSAISAAGRQDSATSVTPARSSAGTPAPSTKQLADGDVMFLGTLSTDRPQNVHDERIPRLMGRSVEYYAYPVEGKAIQRYNRIVDMVRHPPAKNVLFIGQVPNLLPLPYLAWTLDLLLGEYGVHWVLQTAKNGCAKVWTRQERQMAQLLLLTKHVLYDVCGVWVARTDAAAEALRKYATQLKSGAEPCDPRLPRGLMVIESLKPSS
jgi:hypothetical protein